MQYIRYCIITIVTVAKLQIIVTMGIISTLHVALTIGSVAIVIKGYLSYLLFYNVVLLW